MPNEMTTHFSARKRLIVVAISACFASAPAWGNPTAPKVVNGSASFNQAGKLLTVTNSNGAIINWNSFSIAAGETTRFNQASAASGVLNRVIANDPSVLLGTLSSNGRVWLVNPAGIMVGQGARIAVAGFIASTLNVKNEDFLAGRLNFGATPNAGKIENHGQISTPSGGSVYLVAPAVENHGIINAPNGEVILAAGQTAQLIDTGTPGVKVDITGAEGNATNLGEIVAEAGRIGMAGVLLTNTGTLNASSVVREGGRIFLKASRNILSAGRMSADGAQGSGGAVDVQAGYRIVQTAAADLSAASAEGNGGKVTLQALDRNFASGTLRATGGAKGGDIRLLARDIVLAGATLDASGDAGGGSVLIGGDFQGSNPGVANAASTWINYSSAIRADATRQGDGGKVIVWSDQDTRYAGHISARGGAQSGNGGFIEVSGRDKLVFAGMADAGAANGTPGTLLLDPRNIVIDAAGGGGVSSFQLINPYPGAGNYFPYAITALPNGNVVATDPYSDFAASNAGAAYLYNGTTGALISTLTGSAVGDLVSNYGVTALSNGNYVVNSAQWNNGAATQAGAVTFGSGTTGVSGAVSAANSLVGTTAYDWVGYYGITTLSNGNYVVTSPYWRNGGTGSVGAVTFGSGTTGVSGAVSATNSLVGSAGGDQVGANRVTVLTNGNYVVKSPYWSNGGANSAGAVTFGSGTTGVSGAVSATNSLVGSTAGDSVGSYDVTALANGNYVVRSPNWSNGAATQAGAATFGSGTTGISGVVSAANSLVGTTAYDRVGNHGITALSNGNYVVLSPEWANGAATRAGAVTWGNGSAGTVGAVSTANSLVGSQTDDWVGWSVTALSNGDYVVPSGNWNRSGVVDVGAVTWGSGTTGVTGEVSAANSLIGYYPNSRVGSGGVTALSNGNYVVSSPVWISGYDAINAWYISGGAVTWGNGSGGTVGFVSATNSLVGSKPYDYVGNYGITALANGNYVVRSPSWDDGATANAGAVTWGNGLGGTVGVVSAANSLVGSTANDQVGSGVTALSNGNYVVSSPYWSNGAATSAGAVTFGSGTSGVSGPVSASNSLVGSQTNDRVGYGALGVLTNGNYVVLSPYWANGAATQAGAATFGNGTTGVSGVVSAANSLVGSQANDRVGDMGEGAAILALTNGNYVVQSSSWANGATTYAGAVTFGNGTTGVSGAVSATNSLVGTKANESLGSWRSVTPLSNGSVVVNSPYADNGALVDAGLAHVLLPGGGGALSNPLAFSNDPSGSVTITPAQITAITNTGTAVTLQANNDITLAAASNIVSSNPSGDGGALTLQAGRSVLLNSGITTDNGSFTAIAGDPGANLTYRDTGTAAITFGSGASLNVGTGTATLAAIGGTFANNSGSAAPITTTGAGRWLVYSSDPAANTLGGMSAGFKRYNCTYAGGCLTAGTSIPSTGNGLLYSTAPVITVTPDVQAATYGSTGYTSALTGFIDGDTAAVASGTVTLTVGGATSSSGNPIVGAHELTYAGGLASTLGYQFQDAAGSANELTVNARALNVSATGVNKVYDGLLSATATLSDDRVTGDVLAAGGSASYLDKNVGLAKTVNVSGITLTGTDAGNYSYNATAATAADISARALTVSAAGVNKVYDGLTSASVSYADNRVTGDVLAAGGSASYLDKNVGVAKTVNVSGITLSGADAGNYSYETTVAATADITVRPLSIWIGGASGNWSVAANWDALPDLSNVLAVSVPTGKSATYDAAAGNTNLEALSAAGLSIAGGSLNIANSLMVESSFGQSGGTLGFGSSANASITQASGNLNLPALTLANLSLAAPAGAITQSGAIVTAALKTQSQAGTTLTDAGNKIANFTAANSGSGNLSLTNTGVLTLGDLSNTNGNITVDNSGALTTVGAIKAPAGAVSIVAHSPLSIGTGGVSAGGHITLSAGETLALTDHLTLNGVVESTGSASAISLFAGDDLDQNANVTTRGGAVNATALLGNISMALGTKTSTGGGGIGYAASSGNVVLASLDAGSGGIELKAGGDILPAAGSTGANLTGGSARIIAGGSANLSTAVRLLDVTVEGVFSITDALTGTPITNVPAAEPLPTSTEPVLEQVLSTVVATTQQQPEQTTTQTTTPPPSPPTTGGTGPQLLSNSTQTIGGTEGAFGGSSTTSSAPAVDKPAETKPGDDKSASAQKDDAKAGDKKDEKKEEDEKKKKEEEAPAKKEDRPAAKKLATCS